MLSLCWEERNHKIQENDERRGWIIRELLCARGNARYFTYTISFNSHSQELPKFRFPSCLSAQWPVTWNYITPLLKTVKFFLTSPHSTPSFPHCTGATLTAFHSSSHQHCSLTQPYLQLAGPGALSALSSHSQSYLITQFSAQTLPPLRGPPWLPYLKEAPLIHFLSHCPLFVFQDLEPLEMILFDFLSGSSH